MKITKISINKKGTFIAYINGKGKNCTIEDNEELSNSFQLAFQELRNYMNVITELTDPIDNIIMKRVTFNLNKNDSEAVLFSYMRVLTSGKQLLINTPSTSEENMNDYLIMALEEVRKEAIKFVIGERKVEQKQFLEMLYDADSGIGIGEEPLDSIPDSINEKLDEFLVKVDKNFEFENAKKNNKEND